MSQAGDWIGFIPRTIPKCWHYGKPGVLPTFFGGGEKSESVVCKWDAGTMGGRSLTPYGPAAKRPIAACDVCLKREGDGQCCWECRRAVGNPETHLSVHPPSRESAALTGVFDCCTVVCPWVNRVSRVKWGKICLCFSLQKCRIGGFASFHLTLENGYFIFVQCIVGYSLSCTLSVHTESLHTSWGIKQKTCYSQRVCVTCYIWGHTGTQNLTKQSTTHLVHLGIICKNTSFLLL